MYNICLESKSQQKWWWEKETDRQTDRDKDRETERQRQREKDRQTETQRERDDDNIEKAANNAHSSDYCKWGSWADKIINSCQKVSFTNQPINEQVYQLTFGPMDTPSCREARMHLTTRTDAQDLLWTEKTYILLRKWVDWLTSWWTDKPTDGRTYPLVHRFSGFIDDTTWFDITVVKNIDFCIVSTPDLVESFSQKIQISIIFFFQL